AEEEDRGNPERGNEQHGAEDEQRGQGLRRPRRELPARDRPRALHRMETVVRGVTDVVDEIARARRGAVRGERGKRLAPAREVAELRGEDDSCEQEQVLRPLAWAQRDERRARHRPALWEVEDRRRNAHAGGG